MNKLLRKKAGVVVISFVLGVISLCIILLFSDKYSISVVDKETSNFKTIYYYYDLDKDGQSEKLHFIKNNIGQISLLVNKNDQVIDHWNFEGEWANLVKPFIGDYDNDGFEEVFLFSIKNDSLYMHGIDPMNKLIEFQNHVIAKVYKIRGVYDFSVLPGILYDNDNDGIKEIYFSISTGYSTRPRNVFSLNVKKDTVFSSPKSCAAIYHVNIAKFEGDSKPTFFTSTKALGNCDTSRKFSDQFGWFMTFNPDLSFKFYPIRLTNYPSQTKVRLLNVNKDKKFLVCHFYNGTEKYSSFLALYNKNGSVYKKRNITIESGVYSFELVTNRNGTRYSYLITDNKKVYRIDTNLALKEYRKIPKVPRPFFYDKLDIDQDGFNEFIFLGKFLNQLLITRNDFKNYIKIKLDKNILYPVFSVKNDLDNSYLCVDSADYFYILDYHKSFVYTYWYIILILNSLIIYVLFYVNSKIKEYKRLKYKHTQERITKLQLQSFQNQIDPHFTFNIISTFGNLIDEKNTEKANYIFQNYTRMLKSVIVNSDKVFIPLSEELDFVDKYLQLEVYRSNYKFSYEIDVPKGIYHNIFIPKMLLHIFVENAIKHGIKHLDKKGLLKIVAYQKNSSHVITIEDNGVGRIKAKEYAGFSTGKGLQIIEEILVLYNKLYKSNIHFTVDDLYDENRNPTGTLVSIKIPNKKSAK